FAYYTGPVSSLFSSNAPATTLISTLSLHDALPIFHMCLSKSKHTCFFLHGALCLFPSLRAEQIVLVCHIKKFPQRTFRLLTACQDRKSTRLNSSHVSISYAVFCLKKKTKQYTLHTS